MIARISKFVTATGMAAALAVGALPKPAAADTQSTLTTALGAAALIGGIILYNNYEHKKQAANQIVGYTRNGGTVYGDGRIVMPNGQTIYPNSNGQYPWGQTAYYNPNANGYTYDTQRTGRYDTTQRHWSSAYRSNYNRVNYNQNTNRANYNRTVNTTYQNGSYHRAPEARQYAPAQATAPQRYQERARPVAPVQAQGRNHNQHDARPDSHDDHPHNQH